MCKDQKILQKKEAIRKKIKALDKNRIHILYFSYYFNWHNLYKSPLLIATKLLNFITRKPSIDHVAHISRFIYDSEKEHWTAKVFEATTERGMEQNDLFDKLKVFQGTCYIETLSVNVDRNEARLFENRYTGVPYSKKMAIDSGIDLDFIGDLSETKTDGGFCSWLEALFLINQGVDISKIEEGNPSEITPTDLFIARLGHQRVLFRY